ncbi:glutamate receptor ionotropic, NMDA 2A [Trichonephila clavata]|uniref:Glutamate receptor ionotropic, NMDA 2A n=1 Tax=Trichonephila clavata TaxID=2740835 RepID=A0A8X6LUG3_TRICU|nr:glutamate receptor ionotropic, NMDA 2A [Trichonephila clavata]
MIFSTAIVLRERLPQSQVLQLAPSVEHQSSAMLSILRRYSWHKFAIVTSQIGGHDDFVRAVRDQILTIVDFKFTIMDIYTLKVRDPAEARSEMLELTNSEARVFLLYCNRQEAMYIMRAANELDLTGKNYIWIVTQSVVGPAFDNTPPPPDFPPGLLGKSVKYNLGPVYGGRVAVKGFWLEGNKIKLRLDDRENKYYIEIVNNSLENNVLYEIIPHKD